MPNGRKAYRKLLHLSVALLLCATALGARNAHADLEPAFCRTCSTPSPCPDQPASRTICCSVSSGKTPRCQNGWDPSRDCGFVFAYCAPAGN
jgi:hypothetical protein